MLHRILTLMAGLLLASGFTALSADAPKPLRVLVITGGCYHNYPFQTEQLTNALAKVTPVECQVHIDPCTGSTRAELALYDNPDWAKSFDIVIHNECFADTTNQVYIRKITSAHKAGVPAAVIHCAMHTYRAASFDDWREFLGVTTKRHDRQARSAVKLLEPQHPIVKGMPADWTTPMDELYNIDLLWPTAKALASSVSAENGKTFPVIWTNQYGKARVFGTTYGHSDDTWRDPVFLGYVTRGILWAAGREVK